MQVIHTRDSIYQIPLAVIDSVGFVTPKTEYQPDVISLEGAIRDYVIGSDSLTIYFRSNTPFNILPKTGDKLVTTEISDVFWGGFLGKVVDKEEKGDTIALHCEAIGLEEAYKCFYYSTNGASQSDFNKSRAKGLEWDGYYAPDPFVYSNTNFLENFFQPINCPITFTPKFEISIAPTFGSKGSIIVHPLRGVVISVDIHQHTSFDEDLAVSGEIDLSKDISLIPGPIPMYPILPFVSIYGDLGVVFKANGKMTLEEHWGQSLDFDIHYETSYLPLPPMTIFTSIPRLKISNVNFTTEHNGKFMFEGSGAFGGYGEIGIVPWLLKNVAKVGFRFEGGLKLEGNVILDNSDGEGALQSTSLYDNLRAATLSLKSFCSVGMDAKIIGVDPSGVNLFDRDWPLAKYKIVPDFTNTTLNRIPFTATLTAGTTASDNLIFPVDLGFRLFRNNKSESFESAKWSYKKGPQELSTTYGDMPIGKYRVYPSVKLFGIEMLAKPSAELTNETSYILCPDDNHPHAIDLGLPSGTKWACCNVGANEPGKRGCYFSWGEVSEKKWYSNTHYVYAQDNDGNGYVDENGFKDIGSDIAGTPYDAATSNWGTPWHMPTIEQCKELAENTTSRKFWKTDCWGRIFTGPNGQNIFLPHSGWYSGYSDYPANAGVVGPYWSSTLSEDPNRSYVIELYNLNNNGADCNKSHYRPNGLTVRPVR